MNCVQPCLNWSDCTRICHSRIDTSFSTLLILFAFVIFSATAFAQEPIQLGRLQLQISEPAIEQNLLGSDYVSCREEDPVTTETHEFTKLSSTARTSTLKELFAEAELGVDLSVKAIKFKSKIGTLLQSQIFRESGINKDLTVGFTRKKTISPMQCFDQIVEVYLQEATRKVNGGRPGEGFFESDVIVDLELTEAHPQIIVKAFYNHSCDPEICTSGKKVTAVEGVNYLTVLSTGGPGMPTGRRGAELWTRVLHKQTEFFVPLYWSDITKLSDLGEMFRVAPQHHLEVTRQRRGLSDYATTGTVNVRAGPSTSFGIIETLSVGVPLSIVWTTPNRDWHLVQREGDIRGFVFHSFVRSLSD